MLVISPLEQLKLSGLTQDMHQASVLHEPAFILSSSTSLFNGVLRGHTAPFIYQRPRTIAQAILTFQCDLLFQVVSMLLLRISQRALTCYVRSLRALLIL
jgi:hypothetical protein